MTWILNFHGIGPTYRPFDPGEETVWLDVDRFRGILDVVAGEIGFRLTFDDGNRSDIDIALPELMTRGIEATFFIAVGKLGETGFLSREDVRTLAGSGMQIGSHGWSHRSWRSLPRSEATREFIDSKKVLEELAGSPVDAAACPFGKYDRNVLRSLRNAGYRVAFSTDGGSDPGSGFLRPRNTVFATHDGDRILADRRNSRTGLYRRLQLVVKRWR